MNQAALYLTFNIFNSSSEINMTWLIKTFHCISIAAVRRISKGGNINISDKQLIK
jgi:hypothetical protein